MGLFSATSTWSRAMAVFLSAASLVSADEPYSTNLKDYQEGKFSMQPNQTFNSAPHIQAPILQVNTFNPDLMDVESAPYIFTAGGWNNTWGSTIFSSADLSLVYESYIYNQLAQATRVWPFHDKRVYAAVEGGAIRIFNESYHQLYAVTPQGALKGDSPDTHEAYITTNNTVLVITCPVQTVNMTGHGGPDNAQVLNCKWQEIDPENNKVLFQWAVLDYFRPWDSVMNYTAGQPWDFSHQNSVQKLPDGDYLASYRHLSAVIKVDGSNGKVKWVMGGKRNQFTDITPHNNGNTSAYFAYQHDARQWNATDRFTVFDNAGLNNTFCGPGLNCSRGLELEYNEDNKTVSVYNEWYHPQSLVSASRGSVQLMDNGHVHIGWGQEYAWTEYTENGTCILDFQRGINGIYHSIDPLVVYRSWKDQWMPTPPWGPNISAVDSNIYVSWNGLMVSDWLLLLSDDADDLNSLNSAVAKSPRNGFETMFDLSGHKSSQLARVAALSSNGTVLDFTPVVNISSGALSEKNSSTTGTRSLNLAQVTQSISTSSAVTVPTGDSNTNQYPMDSTSSSAKAYGLSGLGFFVAGAATMFMY